MLTVFFILVFITFLPYLSIINNGVLIKDVFLSNNYGVYGGINNCGNCGIDVLSAKDRFKGIIFSFNINLLKRSLSIIGGNTRNSNILTEAIDLAVIDKRGV